MQPWTGPWGWALLALLFLLLEVGTGGTFVALFFAAGAALAGTLQALHAAPEPWGAPTAFVAGSLASLLAARRPLLRWAAGRALHHPIDALVGQTAQLGLGQKLLPGAYGSATLRGSPWRVHNVGVTALAAGTHARIVGLDGLTLQVVAQNEIGGPNAPEKEST